MRRSITTALAVLAPMMPLAIIASGCSSRAPIIDYWPVTSPPVTTAPSPSAPSTTGVPGRSDDPAALSDADVAAILGVVAGAHGWTSTDGGRLEIILVARLGDSKGRPMTPAERASIEAALAPADVTWLETAPATAPELRRGQFQMDFGVPTLVEGRLAVAWAYRCPGLCAAGGFEAVERTDAGWRAAGPVGESWTA